MFILTDGKNYVMENPMKTGEYISSTSINHARKFSYKQARNLVKRKGKKYSWIKNYYLVDDETGENQTSHYITREIRMFVKTLMLIWQAKC